MEVETPYLDLELEEYSYVFCMPLNQPQKMLISLMTMNSLSSELLIHESQDRLAHALIGQILFRG